MKHTVTPEQLGDLLDTRAEIRQLSKRVAEARAAWLDAKSDLTAAKTKLESLLSQLEGLVDSGLLVPAIEIGRNAGSPATVLGQQRTFNTPNEYKVIKVLLGKFPECLTEKELQAKSRLASARRILETIRNRDELWRVAIKVPGKGFPGSIPGIGIAASSQHDPTR